MNEPIKIYVPDMNAQYLAGVQACQARGIYRQPAILVAEVTLHCGEQPLFFTGPLNECSLECPVCGFWRGVWGENQDFAARVWNDDIRHIQHMIDLRARSNRWWTVEEWDKWDAQIQEMLDKRPPAYHIKGDTP